MALALRDLELLAIDCQAGGATPAHGDLLEIGWARCGSAGLLGPVHQHFVIPRTARRVPAAIRELTGWSERCLADACDERAVWCALREDIADVAARQPQLPRALAAIHFARFELPFLRDLHARLDLDATVDRGTARSDFPLDALCLHAIGARLFPDLPRRNIRALAGFLGHSTDLLRRCGGHVEASAFIWQALVPRLEAIDVGTLEQLAAWLERATPARTSARRMFPFAPERRRALPDRPGVYRFLRSNGDVLYVGKAASLRKRVQSHFAGAQRRTTERALEFLSQVQDVSVTETATILEAALLESDEIKRIDPPYNVQLRSGERQAWFATRDWSDATSAPDERYVLGPLPSRRALIGLQALQALVGGMEHAPALQACALSVPTAFLPEPELFEQGWSAFVATHLQAECCSFYVQIEHAARALWLARGRAEAESASAEDLPPDGWDLARVLRRLERTLIGGGLLLRRARWLCLLADADVAIREVGMAVARGLVIARAQIIEHHDFANVRELERLPLRERPPRRERQACFDALAYDRMRILATELNRVLADGGELAVRIGTKTLSAARLRRVTRWI